MRLTKGKYTASIAHIDGVNHATLVEEFGEFDTPGQAYKAASAALHAHAFADRIQISRGELDPFNGVVYPVYVAEWDLNRKSMKVVASIVDDDIENFPVQEAERVARDLPVYTRRAEALGAMDPYAASFARWYLTTGRVDDLGGAYDEWRTARGWKTRAELDADVALSGARARMAESLSALALVDWLAAGSPIPWHGLAA